MEDFFIEENFFTDLDSLMDHFDLLSEQDVMELEDGWSQKIELSELQPMFQLDENFVIDGIMNNTDRWEDRFPLDDEQYDRISTELKSAIKQSVDLVKLNNMIPKLYYPTGDFIELTKQDLLEYIN